MKKIEISTKMQKTILALLKENAGSALPRKQISHFLNIRKNLANDGVIILSKMIDGHQPKDFVDAVDQGGLKINRIFRVSIRPRRYYVEVQHK